jgi:hypothetical protein
MKGSNMNRVVFSEDEANVTAAAPTNAFCPKCGGTKPTCCSFPPTEPTQAGVEAAAKEIRAQFKRRFVIPSESELIAIISKHCAVPAEAAVRVDECTCDTYWHNPQDHNAGCPVAREVAEGGEVGRPSGLDDVPRLSRQEDTSMTKNYDGFRAGMLRAAEMARNEFKRAPEAARGEDCVWMGGYESACDHLSVAIARAGVIDSVRIAGAQPDWQYHIALLLPDEGVEDQALLKIYQVVEHELRMGHCIIIQSCIDVLNRASAIPFAGVPYVDRDAVLRELEGLVKGEGEDGPTGGSQCTSTRLT